MSPRNWSYCPRCEERALEKREEAIKEAKDSYGEVSMKEYTIITEKAFLMPEGVKEQTLREDYKIGMDSSTKFSISYSCYCSVCRFGYKYEHEETFKVKDPDDCY